MMMSGVKKLSIAFYWHMHQPNYQLNSQSDYLMPWVRLHAVKDYYDMLLYPEAFKNLKINFNFVPALLDAFENYTEKGFHDIHSRLTVSEISDLTFDDKEFILNNFFDANYKTMIYHHHRYNELYHKRFESEKLNIDEFTEQEFSDIMAWFNLSWINPIFRNIYPELNNLAEKGANYTLEDRKKIIEYHRRIIGLIIPKIKELLNENKIELSTSPYFHPILPILSDIKVATLPKGVLTENLEMAEDAISQTQAAILSIEEIFGVKPKGIWPPEHCVSETTFKMLSDLGIDWTITDEGILSESINKDFIRDFQGYLEDPYFLMKSYKYKTGKNSEIKVLFRNSAIPNLISFEYANHEPNTAANDLYERIKIIQNKLQSSPDEHHILTIAMDGENCWENYLNDGRDFLTEVYSLIENDKTLETVLISEYLNQKIHHKTLKKVHAGSWINKNFKLWIDEPTKNLAWKLLKKVRDDLADYIRKYPDIESNELAYRELLIAQGSDWFWWYGEPNDSGQDHIFDYIFREHLKNVYKYTGQNPPKFLDTSLILTSNKPSRYPKTTISPKIDGLGRDEDWLNAGCIELPDGPIIKDDKLFDKICFGFDDENFYLRFYIKSYHYENKEKDKLFQQIYVYLRNSDKKQMLSPLRLINPTDNPYPLIKEKFHNEIRLSVQGNFLYPVQFLSAMQNELWKIENSTEIDIAFENTIDLKVPFKLLNINAGERVEFFFANANMGIKNSLIPQDVLLSVQRPL